MKNNSLTFPDFSTKIFTFPDFPDYPENDTILPDFPVCINPGVASCIILVTWLKYFGKLPKTFGKTNMLLAIQFYHP